MQKPRPKRQRNKFRPQKPAQRTEEQVWIDFEKLPADLDEDQLKELMATLPKKPRGKNAVPTSHAELQALSLAELYEVMDEEKLEEPGGRRREEVIWEIIAARLRANRQVSTQGCIDTTKENHTFLRSPHYGYIPSAEDVFVPPSLVKRYGLSKGMTISGWLRPPTEEEQ